MPKKKDRSSSKKEKKAKVSILFEVTIKGIDKLSRDDNGNKMYVAWKRGKKSSNHGKTKEATVQYNFVQWDEKLTLKSTLMQVPSTGAFDAKTIEFQIYQLGGAKQKKKDQMAVVVLNLADYAQPSADSSSDSSGAPKAWSFSDSLQIPIESEKRAPDEKNLALGLESVPLLELSIKSRWLKYNGKLLVVKSADKDSGKQSVNVGGVDFDLQTDKETSDDEDTTMGGSDEESDFDASDFENDDSDFEEVKKPEKLDKSDGSSKSEKSGIFGFRKGSRIGGKMPDQEDGKSDKSDKKKAKKLKEEVESLRNQLRKANEMAQIRLENITAQKREIDNLRLQLESGAAGSRTPPPRAADPLINDLIKTIGISFQKDRNDPEKVCYWLGFASSLLTIFCQIALNDDATPSSIASKLPNLAEDGIDVDKPAPTPDLLRSVPPTVRTIYILELMTSEIYSGLLNAFYKDLDEVFIPVIVDHKSNIDKLELVAKRKGAGGKHSFTWRLTILAEHLQANRISPLIMHQFFTQIFYFIGCKLWNSLLKKPELCNVGFGFQLKYAVSELRSWAATHELNQNDTYQPSRQLDRIQDAAGVLVIGKAFFEDVKIPQDLKATFPSLTLFEIKHLLESYVPDKASSEKGIPVSVKRRLDTALGRESEPSTLERNPTARAPVIKDDDDTSNSQEIETGSSGESNHSSSSSKKEKEKRKGKKK